MIFYKMKKYFILTGILVIVTGLSHYFSGLLLHNDISYPTIIAGLLMGMIIILGGCELFANGVECLAERFNLSHATAGSILAATGTALPETMVPVIALLTARGEHKSEIAIGAILGAPFMLSTLALFLLGITVLIHRGLKKRSEAAMNVNLSALRFELLFFIGVISSLLMVSLLKIHSLNIIAGIAFLILYVLFIHYTLKHESMDGEEYTEHFHFAYFLGCPRRLRWIIGQVLLGLFFIITGAHLFVDYISRFSIKSGIPALVLSLIITPVATELPEKFNSITWTLKGKDTMAIANISGAMVFQSTIPVSIGLIFTEWRLNTLEIFNIISAILMASIMVMTILTKKKVPAPLLLTGGIFYILYILLGIVKI